jgi:3-hydroxyisobutyrate dehydrogenase-like beta-hydroxyacid dehydrogenase
MVRRLVKAGYAVRALARSEEKRGLLAEDGAQVVSDAAEAGDGADAVLVCVYTDEQVRDVCLGGGLLGEMPGGSVLVVHTTGSPRTAEAIAARAAPRGIHVVDSPVSGGPHDVAAGRVTLFVGGAEDAVEQVRPVLRSYGDPILHVGRLGAGSGSNSSTTRCSRLRSGYGPTLSGSGHSWEWTRWSCSGHSRTGAPRVGHWPGPWPGVLDDAISALPGPR